MIRHPSSNHDPRPAGTAIDMLVLHYTGMPTKAAALDRLCDPTAKVSAHYLIDEAGTTYLLVDEWQRAWHAGVSYWRGNRDINSRSIGIELVNRGHQYGYHPFPAAQMAALAALAQGILSRHRIPPRNVVGHSDIAPTRKQDPGELFDWPALARCGVGIWPDPAAGETMADTDAGTLLGRWGYDVADTAALADALVAFQRHFRPSCCDGECDAETLTNLRCLLRMVGNQP